MALGGISKPHVYTGTVLQNNQTEKKNREKQQPSLLKLPKTWKKHHVLNNSLTLCLAGAGTGKTNALINYL
jgi:hypothetical protein